MKIGIVYKIICNITGETYVGSTFNKLEVRMKKHRTKANDCSSKKIIQRGNYRIENVFEGLVDKEELLKKEMSEMKNSENCINILTPKLFGKVHDKKRLQMKMYYAASPHITCECGRILKNHNLIRHFNSKYHGKRTLAPLFDDLDV
jgi:hypothetical protein